MFKSSRDDDQIFVVFMGSRNGAASSGEVANAFLGVLAIAIVLMVFVGLVNDSERRRLRQWGTQPTQFQGQLIQPTRYSTH